MKYTAPIILTRNNKFLHNNGTEPETGGCDNLNKGTDTIKTLVLLK